MIDIVQAQAAIISKLKTISEIVTAIGTADEVRELEWQGDKFTYPNIRVRIEQMEDDQDINCDRFIASGSVYVFSTEKSSLEANTILTLIHTTLSKKSFSVGTVKFSYFRCVQVGARVMEESNGWQSQLQFRVTVS